MTYINLPSFPHQNVTHHTFYSKALSHDVGYNLYVPSGYEESSECYPVVYHIHGWQGNESSDIGALQPVYSNRNAITVFMNCISSEEEYFKSLRQVEAILLNELVPYVESHYRVNTNPVSRMLSGFSMGGNMAFYYAVKQPDQFAWVTSYAGTYHHLYNKGFRTVGVEPEKASEMYEEMLREEWYLEANNILNLVRQNADQIRGKLKISLHVGTADILYCDNLILHWYLESLNIPHEFKVVEGVEHHLGKIV